MIYTVTFNPSLDYIVSVDNFELGMTNRTGSELILPGGKGINTSIVLKNLGIESTALGFVAGFTGREICRRVKDYGIIGNFIQIEKGLSRINVKVKNIDGTEINGAGPEITLDKTNELYMLLDRMIDGDMLILAGSIPTSMSDHTYEDILERISDKKIDIVVDATSNLLLNVLKYKPFLIKPNHHELGEIFREMENEVKRELKSQGIEIGNPATGIMIETPAAVMISDELAKLVDFFSIGTNDLTQYTLAIDRQNSKLDTFYDSHHPAVLKMIKLVVDNAHEAGIWAGICGELAGDTSLTHEFIAMGVDELSVSPGLVLPVRKQILDSRACN